MTINEAIQEIIDESVIDLTTTQMLPYFKGALRELVSLLKYRGFITEGTLTLSAGAQTASLGSLSSGFIMEREIWYVQDYSRVPIYRPQSLEYFERIYTTEAIGKPDYYIIQGTTIRFDKKSDVALTIGFDYFKEISAVTGSDTFLGDERIVQAVKHLCKSEFYGDYEEDEVKSTRHANKAAILIQKIQQDYEDKELAGDVVITEQDGI